MASPKKNPNPKKTPKKTMPKALPGKPMDPDDLPDLPKKPNGEYDYEVLGLAAATLETRKQAIRFYNMFAKLYGFTLFEDLTKTEVSADNAENIFFNFNSFIASKPIPKNCKDGFAPPTANSKAMVMVTHLAKLSIAIKNCLRDKFPDLDTWPRSKADNPAWFKNILNWMCRTWRSNYLNKWSKDPDLTFGNTKIRPLYTGNPVETVEDKAEQAAWYGKELKASNGYAMETPWAGVDLHSMFRRAFMEAHPLNPKSYANGCRNKLTHSKVCRGGDIKWDRWSEYWFCETFQVLNTMKHHTKTLANPIGSPLAWNPKCYFMCDWFWLGLYVFFGEGLRRTQLQVSDHLVDCVFPDEYTSTSATVARRIGQWYKNMLPKGASKDLEASITQKSGRQGAITELSLHPLTNVFDVCGRSGHKTGVNIDSYIDDSNPARGMLGARILAGHTTFSRPMVVPAPYWLPSRYKESFDNLLKVCLAGNSVPTFEQSGQMYRGVQHLLCVQIHWFNDIVSEVGPNHPWVVALVDKARAAAIVDPTHPEKQVIVVLEEWSTLLRERQFSMNDHVDETHMKDYTYRSMYERLQTANERARQAEIAIQRQREDMKECFSEVMSQLVNMQKELAATRSAMLINPSDRAVTQEHVRELHQRSMALRSPSRNAMLASLRAPRTPTSHVRKQTNTPPSTGSIKVWMAGEEEQVKKPAAKASKPPPRAMATQHQHVENNSGNVFFGPTVMAPTVASMAEVDLVNAIPENPRLDTTKTLIENSAKSLLLGKASDVGTGGKVMIHAILSELHRAKWYQGTGTFYDGVRKCPSSCKSQPSKFRYVMQMLEFVCTPSERSRLLKKVGPNHPTSDDIAFYDMLRTKCMDQMWIFEGKDPEVERVAQQNTRGCNVKPTVSALAIRIKAYKVIVRPYLNMPPLRHKAYDDTPLVAGYRKGMEVGTPPDNKSMVQFMVKKRRTEDASVSPEKRLRSGPVEVEVEEYDSVDEQSGII